MTVFDCEAKMTCLSYRIALKTVKNC
jgi:hypothetical protein